MQHLPLPSPTLHISCLLFSIATYNTGSHKKGRGDIPSIRTLPPDLPSLPVHSHCQVSIYIYVISVSNLLLLMFLILTSYVHEQWVEQNPTTRGHLQTL